VINVQEQVCFTSAIELTAIANAVTSNPWATRSCRQTRMFIIHILQWK